MDLSIMRARVRKDLHDEDSSSYRWTDDVLDRHVHRAVREFSVSIPLEAMASLTTTAGSRALDISGLMGMIGVEAVEYPVGKYPPAYVRFRLWDKSLTMLIEGAPTGGQGVNIYYTRAHTLDPTSSIPTHFEDLVALGAAAYAALEWASYATNRENVGGEEVWRRYQIWGQESLAAFLKRLANHDRRNTVRARQLYVPAGPTSGQTTD